MVKKNRVAIKDWIQTMDFELIKTHILSAEELEVNYYSLANFYIYEEITQPSPTLKNMNKTLEVRFFYWNPWGINFEVQSLKELMEAYQDSKSYNPDLS